MIPIITISKPLGRIECFAKGHNWIYRGRGFRWRECDNCGTLQHLQHDKSGNPVWVNKDY